MENVKNDAICHVTRQNQYNPAGGGATINGKGDKDGLIYRKLYPLRKYIGSQANFVTLHVHVNDEGLEPAINLTVASSQN